MRNLILAALLVQPLFSVRAAAQAEALKVQEAFNALAEKARPAVVSVRVLREEIGRVIEPEFYFGYMVPVEKYYRYDTGGLGSGVIVDSSGYVLTNEHVVSGADRIQVILSGGKGKEKTYMAKLVASDHRIDLAVLRIMAEDKETFPYLRFADSPAKVGDWAIAVGYPFGFRQTMTSGIVSALDVSMRIQGRRYARLLQTDAAINEGNSGGPLLNLSGEIIGINSAIFSPSGAFAGMGFAIPASEARRTYDDFLGVRPARRGWLGVAILPVDAVSASRFGLPEGAMIERVGKDSPAAAGKLMRGDIIVKFDGEDVGDDADLLSFIYSRKPGDRAVIEYYRGGKKKTAHVIIGEQPGSESIDFDY